MKKILLIAAIVGAALAGCSKNDIDGPDIPIKTVSVAEQSEELTSAQPGQTTFRVTSTEIEDETGGVITWYADANGTTVASKPSGISTSVSTLNNNEATISVYTNWHLSGGATVMPQGTFYFKVTFDEVTSAMVTLIIKKAEKSVSIGTQFRVLMAQTATGSGSETTFPVNTIGMSIGIAGISIENLPDGVSIMAGSLVLLGSDGYGIFSLKGSATAAAGTYSNLILTLTEMSSEKTQSEPFTLIISPLGTISVSVGEQNGTIKAGVVATVTFPVITTGIPDNNYSVSVQNLPTGVTSTSGVNISGGTGTLMLNCGTATTAGAYDNLSITINSTQSAAFKLIISTQFGSGTQDDPYLINTAADLAQLATLVNNGTLPYAHALVYYRQTANINLGVAPYNSGTGWTPIGISNAYPFKGVYDGGGFTISNLTINDPTSAISSSPGLFGRVNLSEAVIRNVRLTNVNVTGKTSTGGLASMIIAGLVENCRVSGGSITSENASGGLVYSVAEGAVVQNCYVNGLHIECTTTKASNGYAGALIETNVGTVRNCYAADCTVKGNFYAAGLVQWNRGLIEYCYATATVTGKDNAGGIVGNNASEATLRNCVALNKSITAGNKIGRIAAYPSVVSNNYARETGMTLIRGGSAYTPVPDLNGQDGASTTSYGSQTWYTTSGNWLGSGWNFTTVWQMGANLPVLRGFAGDTQNPTP